MYPIPLRIFFGLSFPPRGTCNPKTWLPPLHSLTLMSPHSLHMRVRPLPHPEACHGPIRPIHPCSPLPRVHGSNPGAPCAPSSVAPGPRYLICVMEHCVHSRVEGDTEPFRYQGPGLRPGGLVLSPTAHDSRVKGSTPKHEETTPVKWYSFYTSPACARGPERFLPSSFSV